MSKVKNSDLFGGEYIMNFEDEEEEPDSGYGGKMSGSSVNFLGKIIGGSTSSTEGKVSPGDPGKQLI